MQMLYVRQFVDSGWISPYPHQTQRASEQHQGAPLALRGAMVLTHPFSVDSCWPRLQPESGRCQDGLLEQQNGVVSAHHLLLADPCWPRLQPESGRCQDDLFSLHKTTGTSRLTCLLHSCPRLPRAISAWVRCVRKMQRSVGEVAHHFHLWIISSQSSGKHRPQLESNTNNAYGNTNLNDLMTFGSVIVLTHIHLQGLDFEDLEDIVPSWLNRFWCMRKSSVCPLQHLVARIPT